MGEVFLCKYPAYSQAQTWRAPAFRGSLLSRFLLSWHNRGCVLCCARITITWVTRSAKTRSTSRSCLTVCRIPALESRPESCYSQPRPGRLLCGGATDQVRHRSNHLASRSTTVDNAALDRDHATDCRLKHLQYVPWHPSLMLQREIDVSRRTSEMLAGITSTVVQTSRSPICYNTP